MFFSSPAKNMRSEVEFVSVQLVDVTEALGADLEDTSPAAISAPRSRTTTDAECVMRTAVLPLDNIHHISALRGDDDEVAALICMAAHSRSPSTSIPLVSLVASSNVKPKLKQSSRVLSIHFRHGLPLALDPLVGPVFA